jgi:hypothetical protein
LASSRGDERSWIPDDGGPSLFTRHLLTGLRGAARGRDGWLSAFDLFEHLQPRVTADHRQQHPILKAELEESFAVARRLGGQVSPGEAEGDEPLYDAYLSFAAQAPEADWVWEVLVPDLEAAGLRVAVSGDVEEPGAFRVVGVERALERSRRTVAVLSDAYLEDEVAPFIDAMAQTLGLEQGVARLIPVCRGSFDRSRLPARLRMLVALDLAHPRRGRRNFNRLVAALSAAPPPNR